MTIQLYTQSDRHHLFMDLLERNLIWLLKVLDIPYVSGQTQALLPSTVLAAIRHYYQTYAADFQSVAAREAFPRFLALKYQLPSLAAQSSNCFLMGELVNSIPPHLR